MTRQVFLEHPPKITEEQVDELEALVRKKFDLKTGFAEPHQLARTMENTFKGFDLLRGNMVTKEAFLSCMQKLNCGDNKHVVNALFDRHDKEDKGQLGVHELCAGIFRLKKVPQSNPVCRDVVKIVKERVLQRGGKNGIRTLTRILRLMDDNGNKKLDKTELKEGLQHYGVILSPDELDTVMHYFDRDNDGNISVTEFLIGIRGKMNAQRLEVVKQAYVRLDKDEDRQVTMNDLKMAYDTSHHPDVLNGSKSPEEVLREFCAAWDKNGDDKITEEEFIEYYKDLSAGIENDQYFELMLRNAWHLPGGKDMAANTANRRVCVTHLDGTQTIECLYDDLGIGDDIAKIKDQLRKQGINDILRVTLN